MGIVKRNLVLEDYVRALGVTWELLSDREYQHVQAEVHAFLDGGAYEFLSGDAAFNRLAESMSFDGFIFSSPTSKFLGIYEGGGGGTTFAYLVKQVRELDRARINAIECVIADAALNFACVFSHEWQGLCPEQLYVRERLSASPSMED